MYFDLEAPAGDRGSEGCTILAIEPLKMLSFTWNAPPEFPSIRSQRTHVVVRFISLDTRRTTVSLSHDGWGGNEDWQNARFFSKNKIMERKMKNSKQLIDEFVGLKSLAVVGVSRNKDKFGSAIYRELTTKGYKVFPVNPEMDMFEGDRCFAGVGALPEKPEGVLIVVQPKAAVKILEETAAAGVEYVWLQQGSNSPEGEARAKELNLKLVSGECIFMFTPPVESIHKFHRVVNKIFGKLPK